DKFREARSILDSQGIEIRQLKRAKVEIQDSSIEKIARHAIKTASVDHPELLLVEDSGLFIDALRGFPGPFSSYVYETIGLEGILGLLEGRRRSAYFQTSIAVGSASLRPRTFTGTVRGSISRKIVGSAGFGFDPIFIPEGFRRTFGQTSREFKNNHSHRAKALLKFAKWYKRSKTDGQSH
ncbi:MAG TPA: non-canonical purine NTP pyrophosphatase, partial [Candidatus Angelobacter sp.]|nr:non-canonical purine NTP pyrophosphatase [Candidatus Angelobacter sp.]